MNILAIETSCDETSVAILRDGREVRSNIISSQIPVHRLYGGVVPEIASRKHIEQMDYIIDKALEEAGVDFYDIDMVGVTRGPGLVGALLVGMSAAKAISYYLNVPLVGVHHIEGHICANYISHKDLEPPFLSLVVSGGHTYLVEVIDYAQYKLWGQTRDDASGEAFDKVARAIGLPYPGGPQIDRLAKSGNPEAIEFPRVMLDKDTYDFSFSGLKTAVLNYLNQKEQKFESIVVEDVAASFQQAVVDVLKLKAFRLVEQLGYDKIALAGGVASNSKLREDFIKYGKDTGIKIYYPEPILCTDNAAMIGSAAYYRFLRDGRFSYDLEAKPSLKFE